MTLGDADNHETPTPSTDVAAPTAAAPGGKGFFNKLRNAGKRPPPLPSSTRGRIQALVVETFNECKADDVPHLGATLAYYAIFSLAPVLVIAVAIAGLAYGREAATGQLQTQLESMMGDDGANVVGEAIVRSSQPGAGAIAATVGFVTLIIGASGAFIELQRALNRVWGGEPPKRAGWISFLRRRLLSFALVLLIGLVLFGSATATTAITAIGTWAQNGGITADFPLQTVNVLISFVGMSSLFAMIFKILPDVKIAWGDVWIGALFTGVFFQIGQLLIAQYIGRSPIASTFGAAGSLIVLLIWINYSAQILLIGAEFTQVWARTWGSKRFEAGGALCETGGLSQRQLARKARLERD